MIIIESPLVLGRVRKEDWIIGVVKGEEISFMCCFFLGRKGGAVDVEMRSNEGLRKRQRKREPQTDKRKRKRWWLFFVSFFPYLFIYLFIVKIKILTKKFKI